MDPSRHPNILQISPGWLESHCWDWAIIKSVQKIRWETANVEWQESVTKRTVLNIESRECVCVLYEKKKTKNPS